MRKGSRKESSRTPDRMAEKLKEQLAEAQRKLQAQAEEIQKKDQVIADYKQEDEGSTTRITELERRGQISAQQAQHLHQRCYSDVGTLHSEERHLANVCQEQSDLTRNAELQHLENDRVMKYQNIRISDLSQEYLIAAERERKATAHADEVNTSAREEVTGLRRSIVVADEKFKGIMQEENSTIFALKAQLENAVNDNENLVKGEFGDARQAEVSIQLQELNQEKARLASLTTELEAARCNMEAAVAMKEQQIREEANMFNAIKIALDKEAGSRDAIKEQCRQLTIQNSRNKEYGKAEVDSYKRTIMVLQDENNESQKRTDSMEGFLAQLEEENKNLLDELNSAKGAVSGEWLPPKGKATQTSVVDISPAGIVEAASGSDQF